MKIIDAHHHLWDLETNRYPWLQTPLPPQYESRDDLRDRDDEVRQRYFRVGGGIR